MLSVSVQSILTNGSHSSRAKRRRIVCAERLVDQLDVWSIGGRWAVHANWQSWQIVWW